MAPGGSRRTVRSRPATCDLQLEERMDLNISAIVEQVTKQPIPPHVSALILEICASDPDDEDVEVPYVRLALRPDAE